MKKVLHISSLVLLSLALLVLFLQWSITSFYDEIVLEENGAEKTYIIDRNLSQIIPLDKNNASPVPISRETLNTLKIKMDGVEKVYLKDEFDTYHYLTTLYPQSVEPKKVAILYISTGKYIKFWDNFYKEMEKYFLPNHEKTYFLFTDHDFIKVGKNVIKVHQDQLPWPYITLKRFHFFDGIKDQLKKYDYIYFLNGTMLPVDFVTEEIFPTKEQEIMVTLHPWWWLKNKFYLPYDKNPNSKAYISDFDAKYYVMGGFNGGTSEGFLKLIDTLKRWTDIDIKNKVMPRWHDESMLNRYLATVLQNGNHPLILLPEYAVPETGMPKNLKELLPHVKMWILDKKNYGGHSFLRGETEKELEKDTNNETKVKSVEANVKNKNELEKAKKNLFNPTQNVFNIQKALDF